MPPFCVRNADPCGSRAACGYPPKRSFCGAFPLRRMSSASRCPFLKNGLFWGCAAARRGALAAAGPLKEPGCISLGRRAADYAAYAYSIVEPTRTKSGRMSSLPQTGQIAASAAYSRKMSSLLPRTSRSTFVTFHSEPSPRSVA